MWPFKKREKKYSVSVKSNADSLTMEDFDLPVIEDIKAQINIPTEYKIERMANAYIVWGWGGRVEIRRAFNSPDKAVKWVKEQLHELERIINIEKLKQ